MAQNSWLKTAWMNSTQALAKPTICERRGFVDGCYMSRCDRRQMTHNREPARSWRRAVISVAR
uniref:Uncharacterized protein n=1 Tax=Cucumis melo TaxID=3656 RepID=A0A9I9D7J3_CUCME